MLRVIGSLCKRKKILCYYTLGGCFMGKVPFFSSAMQGKTSHKFFDPSENFILRLYYQKDVLTVMCFCNEMFYSGLYLLHFTNGPTSKHHIQQLLPYCTRTNLHICFIWIFLAVLGISIFKILTGLSFPVAVAKAGASLLHAWVAAQNLSIIDQNERAAIRQRDAAKKPEWILKSERAHVVYSRWISINVKRSSIIFERPNVRGIYLPLILSVENNVWPIYNLSLAV